MSLVNPSLLRVGVFTPDTWEHVCPMVRVIGPAQFSGVEIVRGVEWENGEIRIFPEIVSQVDVILVVRDFPRYFEALTQILEIAKDEGKPIVYELDDLLLQMSDEHPDYAYYVEGRADTIHLIKNANAVIGSTPQICDYLRTWNPNVWHFPNYLNDQIWELADKKKVGTPIENTPVVIGYMGGHSHQQDLEMIAPVLYDICGSYGNRVLLKFYGIQPPVEIRDLKNVEFLNPALVSYMEFAAYFSIQDVDIFLAPLKDNLFNCSKSHLKFLEYSALGVPGIYSRIEPYESVVDHGQNGFLVSTANEWQACLTTLIENPELRMNLGNRALETVKADWPLSNHSHEWSEFIRNVQSLKSKTVDLKSDQVFLEQMIDWYREISGQVVLVKSLQQMTKSQETAIRDLKLHAENLAYQKQQAEDLIDEITHSNGWILLEKLRAFRVRLAPHGSARERALLWSFESYHILRKDGFYAWLRNANQRTRGAIAAAHAGPLLRATITPGTPKSSPLCSILILKDVNSDGIDEQKTLDWCQSQTCHQMIDLVVWDQISKKAWTVRENSRFWDAPDQSTFINGLQCAYLCVASPDLLRQDNTYLETNLIVLESEQLAFTVNLRGHNPWVEKYFERGFLPGNKHFPLLRLVASKENVGDGFSLNLMKTFEKLDEGANLVGKVLIQTTNYSDAENSLPFESAVPAINLKIRGRHIFASNIFDEPWEDLKIQHSLHPVDSIVPVFQEPDERPTMILVQSFLAVGGAERVHLDLMGYLKDDIRFVVLTGESMDVSLGTTSDAHREITPFVYTSTDYLDWNLNFSQLIYLIERFQPDTLYFANGVNWMYDSLPELKRRYPRLWMGNQVYDSVEGWINRYDEKIATCFDANICSNEKIGRAYLEHGVELEKIYLISNGVATDEFDPTRFPTQKIQTIKSKLGIPAGRKVVTYISRFHPQKRPMDFVEMARRFSQDPSIVFLMIGDGPLSETVDAEITRIGIKNIVRHSFTPSSEVFAISNVMVLPSEYEGMPMIILEAQAMGVPIVVTDVGNNQEVLDITSGGVLVPIIGDIAALANGVQAMLKNPPEPEEIRQSIVERFSLAQMGENYRKALMR